MMAFWEGSIGLVRGASARTPTPGARGGFVFWVRELEMPGAAAAHAALGLAPGSSLWVAAVETSDPCSPLTFNYGVWTKTERAVLTDGPM